MFRKFVTAFLGLKNSGQIVIECLIIISSPKNLTFLSATKSSFLLLSPWSNQESSLFDHNSCSFKGEMLSERVLILHVVAKATHVSFRSRGPKEHFSSSYASSCKSSRDFINHCSTWFDFCLMPTSDSEGLGSFVFVL